MSKLTKIEREQTRLEEIANSASHGIGALALLLGTPFLILSSVRSGSGLNIAAACIFAFSALLLYSASALYHALPEGLPKERCRVMDHSAIYLLIAGTYTPFTLGVLRGTLGWTLFALVWTIALGGIILETLRGIRNSYLAAAFYLAMGWLILFAARTLYLRLPAPGLFWLAAGGIAYTVGVIFYISKHVPYFHLVWHLFVLTGTTCHFLAILWYAV